jgi:hypothetical protein
VLNIFNKKSKKFLFAFAKGDEENGEALHAVVHFHLEVTPL